ncbi:MAG: N-acetylmuramoyl-L-alanine amidase [Lachnospiraceae bacterium]|nr:N-acetylmuramoyl-L-alanine amidase [Lachnospiraceae bacterium]
MLINVDSGHGSSTAGKRTPPIPQAIDINRDGKMDINDGEQYREHNANVGVANFLVKELERCGFDTMRTGWDDDNAFNDLDQALSDRQKAIAKAGCDYSISIHFNAFGDGKTFNSAEGVGIYIHNKYAGQSEKLAEAVLKHLAEGTRQKNRGISSAALAMCNCNNMDVKAAILCELAFMTNLREAMELMACKEFWKKCAAEICRGVCEYTGAKYLPEEYTAENYISQEYIPDRSITPESDSKDIKWAQKKLNAVLPDWLPRLKVDGDYGPKTRIAVLVYWDKLGWGKHLEDSGKTIGKATKEALVAGRRE